ncbi:hypothetical protein PFISCL1PPCAC_16054, partial [Pristionchus fissidentatus]
LSPEQGSDSECETPQPLLDGERRGGEPATTKLHDENLRHEGSNPDDVVDGIGEESLQDGNILRDLSRIDLVEEGHHDESVEDDGEVLRGRRVEGRPST